MECDGQKNGFIKFKRSKKFGNLKTDDTSEEKKNYPKIDTIKIPSHVREQIGKIKAVTNAGDTIVTNQSNTGGSRDYRSDIEKIRTELAEIRRQKEEMLQRGSLQSK